MSADNGIFVFNTDDGRIGVVHHTMSGMPLDIPEILKNLRTCYNDEPKFFDRKDANRASAYARKLVRDEPILEYGIVDWTGQTYEDMMRPYLAGSDSGILFGSESELAEKFTSFHADDAEGIFALGIDETDPSFDGGVAVIFGGDDGMFSERARFSLALIPAIAEALDHARQAAQRLCVKSGGNLVLRSKDTEPLPMSAPRGVRFRHRGMLASSDACLVLAGEMQSNPQFALMIPNENGNEWKKAYSASVFWLDCVAGVVAKAAAVNSPSHRR